MAGRAPSSHSSGIDRISESFFGSDFSGPGSLRRQVNTPTLFPAQSSPPHHRMLVPRLGEAAPAGFQRGSSVISTVECREEVEVVLLGSGMAVPVPRGLAPVRMRLVDEQQGQRASSASASTISDHDELLDTQLLGSASFDTTQTSIVPTVDDDDVNAQKSLRRVTVVEPDTTHEDDDEGVGSNEGSERLAVDQSSDFAQVLDVDHSVGHWEREHGSTQQHEQGGSSVFESPSLASTMNAKSSDFAQVLDVDHSVGHWEREHAPAAAEAAVHGDNDDEELDRPTMGTVVVSLGARTPTRAITAGTRETCETKLDDDDRRQFKAMMRAARSETAPAATTFHFPMMSAGPPLPPWEAPEGEEEEGGDGVEEIAREYGSDSDQSASSSGDWDSDTERQSGRRKKKEPSGRLYDDGPTVQLQCEEVFERFLAATRDSALGATEPALDGKRKRRLGDDSEEDEDVFALTTVQEDDNTTDVLGGTFGDDHADSRDASSVASSDGYVSGHRYGDPAPVGDARDSPDSVVSVPIGSAARGSEEFGVRRDATASPVRWDDDAGQSNGSSGTSGRCGDDDVSLEAVDVDEATAEMYNPTGGAAQGTDIGGDTAAMTTCVATVVMTSEAADTTRPAKPEATTVDAEQLSASLTKLLDAECVAAEEPVTLEEANDILRRCLRKHYDLFFDERAAKQESWMKTLRVYDGDESQPAGGGQGDTEADLVKLQQQESALRSYGGGWGVDSDGVVRDVEDWLSTDFTVGGGESPGQRGRNRGGDGRRKGWQRRTATPVKDRAPFVLDCVEYSDQVHPASSKEEDRPASQRTARSSTSARAADRITPPASSHQRCRVPQQDERPTADGTGKAMRVLVMAPTPERTSSISPTNRNYVVEPTRRPRLSPSLDGPVQTQPPSGRRSTSSATLTSPPPDVVPAAAVDYQRRSAKKNAAERALRQFEERCAAMAAAATSTGRKAGGKKKVMTPKEALLNFIEQVEATFAFSRDYKPRVPLQSAADSRMPPYGVERATRTDRPIAGLYSGYHSREQA